MSSAVPRLSNQPVVTRGKRTATWRPGLPFRLFTIDVWRVHGLVFIVLAGLAAAPTIRTGWTPGVVLWSEVTHAGAEAAWMVATMAAGFGAWTAGRNRRNDRLIELAHPVSAPEWAREASLLMAVLYWSLLTQLLIFGGLAVYGLRFATFGGPFIDVWITAALGVVASALAGVLVGRTWSHPLAALLSTGVVFGVLIVTPTLDSGSSLMSLVEPDGWRYESLWFDDRWTMLPQVLWFYGSLAAMGLLLWAASWVFRAVAVPAVVALAALVIITGGSAADVWTQQRQVPQAAPGPPTLRTDVELQCQMLHGFDICLHPAFVSLRDDVEGVIGPQALMFGGLAGMPSGVRHSPGTETGFTSDAPGIPVGLIDIEGARRISFAIADAVFPHPSGSLPAPVPGRFSAAQLVVLHVLNPENSGTLPVTGDALTEPLNPFQLWHGEAEERSAVPREISAGFDPVEWDAPPDEVVESWYPRMHEAASRFAALSPEQQRAWLEANWEALRSGQLTLEELP